MATQKVRELQPEFDYSIEEIFIDGDSELTAEHGEKVPVIYINGKAHDFFRVDETRFRKALA